MLRGLSRIWTSVRSRTITEGPVVAGAGTAYTLYPMQENMIRLLNFSGSGGGRRLTPVELSCFLYDFAQQDIDALKKRQTELKAEVSAMRKQPAIQRFIKALVDSDYRNAGSLDLALKTRAQWIDSCFGQCMMMVSSLPVADVPVATVSNVLFAGPKLGLDVAPHLDAILPVLRAKSGYLHAEGIAETLWGLTNLGVNDSALFLQLLKDIKGRKFVSDQSQGVAAWLNHLEYIPDPNPQTGSAVALLREALEKLAKSKDPAVEAEAAAELKARKP